MMVGIMATRREDIFNIDAYIIINIHIKNKSDKREK